MGPQWVLGKIINSYCDLILYNLPQLDNASETLLYTKFGGSTFSFLIVNECWNTFLNLMICILVGLLFIQEEKNQFWQNVHVTNKSLEVRWSCQNKFLPMVIIKKEGSGSEYVSDVELQITQNSSDSFSVPYFVFLTTL